MPLLSCARCGAHVLSDADTCPSCGAAPNATRFTAAAALMGLALVACGDKDGSDSGPVALYGVPDTGYVDNDGDGVAVRDGDCNDDDATVFPGATETAGDTIDSNCDGGDDT
ncbi:putative metal-binding motif-containing protein [Myxococcota bacterium]|nr:putative metal-binding motif-containing protein [Myxococcota bacterium]